MGILRRLWTRWKAFARRIGDVQTTILLTVIYHIPVAVLWLVARVRREDLLGLGNSGKSSYWVSLPETTSSVEQARRQF